MNRVAGPVTTSVVSGTQTASNSCRYSRGSGGSGTFSADQVSNSWLVHPAAEHTIAFAVLLEYRLCDRYASTAPT